MSIHFEKRYHEVAFSEGWTKVTAVDGRRHYTAPKGGVVDITTAGGHRQNHTVNEGDTVICGGGDAEITIG